MVGAEEKEKIEIFEMLWYRNIIKEDKWVGSQVTKKSSSELRKNASLKQRSEKILINRVKGILHEKNVSISEAESEIENNRVPLNRWTNQIIKDGVLEVELLAEDKEW